MPIEKIFPTILIVLDFIAGAVYACKFDFKNATYWACAGLLSVCVVWWE